MAIDDALDRLSDQLDSRLANADAALAARFPGERPGRQPIHTVYVPADRYTADLPAQWGRSALDAMDATELGDLLSDLTDDVDDLLARVRAKLASEPIEDLRIDFEDGYGPHSDNAEDADVEAAASALAESLTAGVAPPFHGIRFKSFEAPTRYRGLRTYAAFVDALATKSAPFDGFVATLPKVTSVDQVEAMVFTCGRLEGHLGLATNALRFEIQVETPQSILGADGTALVAQMIHSAGGRCTALHYGTYDYSAFCGIAAQYQSMEHPVADHAKLVMQAAAAGTGVRLSDGSTNVIPVGDSAQIRSAWALHLRLVQRSLERGYYQGWDLHPAQLPTRYAATIAFYRNGFVAATTRLRNYVAQADSGIMDEPATARALADFLLRGLYCGAATEAEITEATGLDAERLTALARPGR